jgi:uncharacterized protein with HEPN domain
MFKTGFERSDSPVRDDRDLVQDMLERIQLTYTFTSEGREVFMISRLVQEAVLRNLEIIGEAARVISEDLRLKHAEIPWKQIGAFRNFVIHVYWSVKLERIWQIIEVDLPLLQFQNIQLIAELDSKSSNDV